MRANSILLQSIWQTILNRKIITNLLNMQSLSTYRINRQKSMLTEFLYAQIQ